MLRWPAENGWRRQLRRVAGVVRARAGVVSLAVIALAAVIYLAPALFTSRVMAGDDLILTEPPQAAVAPEGYDGPSNSFNWDSAYVFHPDLIAARREVRSGRLPAWTHHVGGGRSLLATQQTAPLYPANWLAYVLDFWTSLEWTALLKLLVAGLGMAVLLRDLRLAWPAAVFGAVAFMLSTYLLVWMAHPHSNVYVLAPLMAAFAARTACSGRLPDAAVLGGVVGLGFLGGHPQSLLIVGALIVVPYGLVFAFREPGIGLRSLRVAGQRLLVLVAAGSVGVLAGAIMVLPFAEALQASSGYGPRGGGNLPRSGINAFFFPELWGRPDRIEIGGGPANFQERTGYFGVIALLLAVAGLVARRPTQAQLIFVCAATAATALVFVPEVTNQVTKLPGFGQTFTYRSVVVIAFCGTALAAFGVHALTSGTSAQRRRLALAIVAIGAVVPIQWIARHPDVLATFSDVIHHVPTLDASRPFDPNAIRFAQILSWTLFAVVAAACAALAVWRPRAAVAAAVVLVVAAAYDSMSVGRGYIPVVDRDRVDIGESEVVSFFAERSRQGERVSAEQAYFGPNLANRWQANDARAHAHPSVTRYDQLWIALSGQPTFARSHFATAPDAGPLLDVFSVRWILSMDLEANPQPQYSRVEEIEEWPVWENLDRHPRARTVTRWRPATDLGAAKAGVEDDGAELLRSEPVIEGASDPPPGAEPAEGRAEIVHDSPKRVRLLVDAPEAGYVILNDIHYPGWTARVDGEDAEIAPANIAFRAVEVPAGRHEVEFRYRSAAVRWGLAGSFLGWGAIAVALAAPAVLRRRRARVHEASRRDMAEGS